MPNSLMTLGGLANAPRRQMTPEEQAMLWSQGQQGMQPQVAPMSLLDLAMEGVGSFLDEADVSQYLLPATLLGLVRYKRPGVSAAARETAEKYHRAPVSDPIHARDMVFHATDPGGAAQILHSGEIVPRPGALSETGVASWPEYMRLRPLEYEEPLTDEGIAKVAELAKEWQINPKRLAMGRDKGLIDYVSSVFGYDNAEAALAQLGYRIPEAADPNRGVSVSRVPRVNTKQSRAVSFVIPREKMPPSRPFTEPTYRKTEADLIRVSPTEWQEVPGGKMNPRFEFEDRTRGQEVPLNAVREMWVDKSALPGAEYLRPDNWTNPTMLKTHQAELRSLRDLAAQYGIPLREFSSGREMHSGRVKPKK